MNERPSLGVESSAVQKHLEMMQGVIQRMADNSRSCKLWCVTLVSAILVLVARTGKAEHALIALAPTVLFYVLDAYYLALERGFRRSHERFVCKLHEKQLTESDIYTVAPTGSTPREIIWSLFKSFSILPFYAVVVATVVLAWLLIV